MQSTCLGLARRVFLCLSDDGPVSLAPVRQEETALATEIMVLKFGSSVLRKRADVPALVHEIYRWYRRGHRVLAVVSAIGEHTEALLAEAQALCPCPEDYATAELLATGERRSAALLGIALDRAGIPARVLDPR